MLLDVAFDRVLDQVGHDRVQDRAEHEVVDALGAGRVDEAETHGPLARAERCADVVDLLDVAHAASLDGGIGEVPDHDVVDPQGA